MNIQINDAPSCPSDEMTGFSQPCTVKIDTNALFDEQEILALKGTEL